jgi:prevent-host-death family protein
MTRPARKGVEEARKDLPALLALAQQGHSTVITRHGRPVAAIVPIGGASGATGQKSLLSLEGSGRGLWGKSSTRAIRRLRDEWR